MFGQVLCGRMRPSRTMLDDIRTVCPLVNFEQNVPTTGPGREIRATVVTPTEVVLDVRRPVPNMYPTTYMHWHHQRRVTFVCWETMWDDLWVVTDELEHAPEASTLLNNVSSVPPCISHCGGLRNDVLGYGISARKILQSAWLVT